MIVDFVGQSYKTRSTVLGAETCINMYPVLGSDSTKYKSGLYPTPGLSVFSNISGNQVRGLKEHNGVLYAVVDTTLYSVNSSGTATSLGTLQVNYNRVDMACNEDQLCIVDGEYGYTYTFATSVLARVTDVDFIAPNRITFQDGYMIWTQPNSSQWWISGINDFSAVDELDFADTNSISDNNVVAISSQQQIIILKNKGGEIWTDTGNEDFPFERRSEVRIEMGCAAPFSAVAVDNTIFWLSKSDGGQGLVVRLDQNLVPAVISHDGVNYAISTYSDISDAFAYTYLSQGHQFYVLTFPSADRTWVYDITTGLWHERRSVHTVNAGPVQGRHRSNCYAFFNGKHIVGDYESGKLYEMSDSVYDENGSYITRERTSAHFFDKLNNITVNKFQLDLETGIGLESGQGSDPQLMFQFSRNGGRIFGSEIWRTAGTSGNYSQRVIINRLGHGRDWVARVRMTDPVPWVLLQAEVEAEASSS